MNSTSRQSTADTIPQQVRANFPPQLLAREQWVCWKAETRNGRITKVPYSPLTGRRAVTTSAATWGGFEQAAAIAEASEGTIGLGFVFSADDPYCGIDFDHCIDPTTGLLLPRANEWIARLDSYTELSPSGTGLHVIAEGALTGPGRKRDGIEIYDRTRFFTVTGLPFSDAPRELSAPREQLAKLYESLARRIDGTHQARLALRKSMGPELPDEEVIAAINASPRRSKFQQLWAGSWKEHYGSQSEADLALVSLLAEFVGYNLPQVDRLFRRSALYRRKWDEHRGTMTYGERTLALTFGE